MPELTPVLTDAATLRERVRGKVTRELAKVFPVDLKGRTLEVKDVKVLAKEFSPEEQKAALLTGESLSEPVKATLVLKDADGRVVNEARNFTLTHLPWFSERHTILMDGNEYQVANMLRRRPGAYTQRSANGELHTTFNLSKGANFNVTIDPAKATFYLVYDSTNIPLYPVLRALGLSHDAIARELGAEIAHDNQTLFGGKEELVIAKLYQKLAHESVFNAKASHAEKLAEVVKKLGATAMDPHVTRITLGAAHDKVTPQTLLAAAKKLLRVHHGHEEEDDADSLAFKTFHSVDDFLAERVRLTAREWAPKVRMALNGKETIRGNLKPAPFSPSMRQFITSSALTAVPTGINPIELIDHSVKVTALGEGGIPSERAIPFSARLTHPTHFGILDPIRTPECYDRETEVLTYAGWKKWPDVTLEDRLACRVDGRLEFHKPEKLIAAPYRGVLHGVKNSKIEYLVTPNHRVLCAPLDAVYPRERAGSWRISRADEVHGKPRVFDTGHEAYTGEALKNFELPVVSGPHNVQNVGPIDMELWASFMGWYISEGSIGRHEGRLTHTLISQDQTANPWKCEIITLLLNKLPFTWRYDESTRAFAISGKQLATYLEPFGFCGDKFIPEYLFESSVTARENLLESLLLGDGRIGSQRKTGERYDQQVYCTTSARLAQDVERLALSLGRPVRVSRYEDRREERYLDVFEVRILRHRLRQAVPKKGHYYTRLYDDMVYCATVPGGLMYVRRGEGTGLWSGNSGHAGVDIRATIAAHRDEEGNLFTPLRNVRTNKVEFLSATDMMGKVIAFPHQRMQGQVDALHKGQVKKVDAKDVDYQQLHVSHTYSPTTSLVPLLHSIQGNRAIMGSKHQTQGLPLVHREAPLVQVKHPDGGSYEDFYGRMVVPVAPVSGVVKKIENGFIYIEPKRVKKAEEEATKVADRPVARSKKHGPYTFEIEIEKGDKPFGHPFPCDYGYLPGFEGPDGDSLDFWVGDDPDGALVSVDTDEQDEKGVWRPADVKFIVGVPLEKVGTILRQIERKPKTRCVNRTEYASWDDLKEEIEDYRRGTKAADYGGVWANHAALNFGDALRQLRYPLEHPRADTKLEALKLRTKHLADDVFYGVLPPQSTGHTPEDLESLEPGSLKEWFLHGYRPDRHPEPGVKAAEAPRHVVVVGHSGAGKSTLASRLSQERGLPLVRFDKNYPKLRPWLFDKAPIDDDFHAARRESVQDALALATPHVIEGTAAMVDPGLLAGHEVHLVDAPRDEIVNARFRRATMKRDRKGMVYDPTEVKRMGETLYDLYEPEVARFRNLDDVVRHETKYEKTGEARVGDAFHAVKTAAAKELVKVPYSDNFPFPSKTRLHHDLSVKPGDTVETGQMLGDSNFTRAGTLASGLNARVAYMPYYGLNSNDAVVISEGFAQRMTSEHVYREVFPLNPTIELSGKRHKVYYGAKYQPSQYAHLDENGVVKRGARVNPHDILVAGLTKAQVTGTDLMLGKISKTLTKPYQEVVLTWEHGTPGEVVDVVRTPTQIAILVKTHEQMQIGDKLCYDDATEVLTARGWLKFTDLAMHDRVASLDGGHLVYTEPTAIHTYPRGGRMYRLDTQQVDLFVTEGHRMYVQPRGAESYALLPARDVAGRRVRYKKDADWVGETPPSVVFPALTVRAGQGGVGTRDLPAFELTAETYAMLLGAYLSEGNVVDQPKTGDYGIDITQVKSPNRGRLLAELTRRGLTYCEHSLGTKVRIYSKQLLEHFRQFGHAENKHIPAEVFGWARETLWVLFDWLMWGDGHAKSGRPVSYTTTSPRLADDVQRLCLHLGYAANIKRSHRPVQVIKGRRCQCRPRYDVRIVTTKLCPEVNHGHVRNQLGQRETWIEDYEGAVHCVTVPSGIVYVRRNGKAVWSGNSGRYGNKGVVAKIVPDKDMIKDASGKPVELIITSAGVVSRINPAQLHESLAGKVAEKIKKPILYDNASTENAIDWVERLAKQHSVNGYEHVFDPLSGRKIVGPDGQGVFVGRSFIFKLFKSTDTNFAGHGVGPYDVNEQPLKQGGEEGAKGLGKMEVDALLAHNARGMLSDAANIRGQKNEAFWRAIQLGQQLPAHRTSFAFKKFQSMLEGAGVKVRKEGSKFRLLPATDADIAARSNGAIENKKTVVAKNLKPEKGGLFDPYVTGGTQGTLFAHIDLHEPVPNPVFEEPVRRLLGLTEKKFQELLKEKGGAHIKQQLRLIDIDKRLKELEEKIKLLKGSELNDAVKQIKYLRALKAEGIRPEDAYVLSKVPVVPPVFRPITPQKNDPSQLMVSDANKLYVHLMDVNEAVKDKVLESDVPKHRAALYNAVGAVFGTHEVDDQKLQKEEVKGFLTQVSGQGTPKGGFFQRKLMKRQQDVSGRGTAVPDGNLHMDSVSLPEDMLWQMFDKLLVARLIRKGYGALHARELVDKRAPAAKQCLLEETKERPVLINRAPTLHRFGIVAAYAQPTMGKTIRVSPFVEKGMNLDYDGDTLQVHVPLTHAGIEDAKRMTMSNLLLSDQTRNKLMAFPQHEAIIGVTHALKYEGNKTKPVRKFKTREEALAAWRRGDLKMDDIIEVG